MVKTLSSNIKDSQHALEIFRGFNFPGKKNSFSLRILLYSILLCPILNYCNLFYPILFNSMILYYKSTSLSVSLASLYSFFKAICQRSTLNQNSFSKFYEKISFLNGRNERRQHKFYSYSSQMQFSTKDQDSDLSSASCAQLFKGAWWYNECHWSNLNGLYLNGQHSAEGVNWITFRDHHYSLKRTEMKVKNKG